MNIPVKQILAKMGQELGAAEHADEARLREHLLVIRSLCEVVLQEQPVQTEKILSTPTHSLLTQPKKNIETDDEGNGDSLFDF
ncbi:YwdI family protein [Bacillus pinisoli]|uniref:YwdI family protein n=1 Tax=Bacillus pinisoli TaxID=2901866 RepID=UPI001FF4642F|nr:YwdI family protein [Bacillus pinisoli]